MKKPFTNYLKLLRAFLRTDKFVITKDDCYRPNGYELVFESERILISEEQNYPPSTLYYLVKYGTGEVRFTSTDNAIKITLRSFQKANYDFRTSLDINGKDEFFNYIMHNDVDYLTYEDLEVLKEIKNLTLKIIKKEAING